MIRFSRGSALAVGTAVLFSFSACQSEPTLPEVPPAPATTVRAVIASTSLTDFPPDIYLAIPIPLAQGGVLDFTINWTHPETYMIVSFGNQSCTYTELSTHKCPFILTTQGSDKPRVITTPFEPAGNYVLVLYSQPYSKKTGIGTDQMEAVSVQIGLTVSTVQPSKTIPLHPQLIQP